MYIILHHCVLMTNDYGSIHHIFGKVKQKRSTDTFNRMQVKFLFVALLVKIIINYPAKMVTLQNTHTHTDNLNVALPNDLLSETNFPNCAVHNGGKRGGAERLCNIPQLNFLFKLEIVSNKRRQRKKYLISDVFLVCS